MQNNETAALDLIIRWEGPEVNISNSEPGGISKYGVSLTTYSDYCKRKNLPLPTANTITDMEETDARAFYSDDFLPAIRFSDLPNGVDVRVADTSISLGKTGAVNLLQQALLQYPLTNTISNTHIDLINKLPSNCVILAISSGWIATKHAKANTEAWAEFGHGWTNRNIAVTGQCLTLTGANT